jgi:hypothetical protein
MEQQDARRLQVAEQAIQQRPVARVPQSAALRNRGEDEIRVLDRGQRHEVHAVREAAGDLRRQLEAKPGLAAATRAGEGQQAAALQQGLQILQLALPADEAGQLAWQVTGKPIPCARWRACGHYRTEPDLQTEPELLTDVPRCAGLPAVPGRATARPGRR